MALVPPISRRTKVLAVSVCIGAACYCSVDYLQWRHHHTKPTITTSFARTKEIARIPCDVLEGYDVIIKHHWMERNNAKNHEQEATIAAKRWRPFGFEWLRNTREQRVNSSKEAGDEGERFASMAIAPSSSGSPSSKYSAPPSFLSEATSQSMVKCSGSLVPTSQGIVNDPDFCKQSPSVLCPTYLRVMMTTFALLPWPLPARLEIGHLGVASGALAMFQQRYIGKNIFSLDLVDVEPQALRVAVDYFGLRKLRLSGGLNLVSDDAEHFLIHTNKRYDVLLVDCFVGTEVPSHLLQQSFMKLCKASLSPQGVVAFNIPARSKTLLHNMVVTFGEGNVVAIPCPHTSNVVVIAGTDLPKLSKYQFAKRCTKFSRHWQLPYDLGAHLPLRFMVF